MKKFTYFLFFVFCSFLLVGCEKHQYTVEVIAPTCTEEGYTVYECECGKGSYIDHYVPALGHTAEEFVVTKEPTVFETGIKQATCTVCNTIFEAEVPALKESYDISVGEETFEDFSLALQKALETNQTLFLHRGSYTLPSLSNKTLTVEGTKEATLNVAGSSANGSVITLKGLTVAANQNEGSWYVYNFLDAQSVSYEDCVITGNLTTYANKTSFVNCTFKNTQEDMYNVYCYSGSEVTFEGCDFDNYWGKAIKLYDEGNTTRVLTVKDCTFTAEVVDKAAIEIDGTFSKGYTVNIENVTVDEVFGKVWNADAGEDKNMIIYVDGVITCSSQNQLVHAMKYVGSEETVINLLAGTYTVPGAASGKSIAFIGTEGTVVECKSAVGLNGGSLRFENLTLEGTTKNYVGYQHSNVVIFNNCVINAGTFLYANVVEFNDCEFNLTTQYIWTYGAVETSFNNCVFNTEGKAILIYNEGSSKDHVVNVYGCEFNASKEAFTAAGDHCAAIEIDSSLISGKVTLNFGDVTADDNFAGIYRIKKQKNSNAIINLEIMNAYDLRSFAKAVNGGDKFTGRTVKLGANIDLNNEEWTPIGNSTTAFEGTFDGCNYTISNLKATSNPSGSNIGLFGFTQNGSIKNLVVENAEIKGRLNVGVVAGTPYTSKYENITVKGNVKVDGMSYVGGVGGKNAYADWTNITVDVNTGSYVRANSVENGTAYRTYVGGVVGFMGEGSHTFSNITSNINVHGSTLDVGGIVGIAHYGNNFKNITCSGNVTIENAPAEGYAVYIGGIAGTWYNQAGTKVTLTNCTFTGTLAAYIDGVKFTNFVNNGLVGEKYSNNSNGELVIQTINE